MLIHCTHCKEKFVIDVNESSLEGKLVKCTKCNKEWVYITRSQNLENRVNDLGNISVSYTHLTLPTILLV